MFLKSKVEDENAVKAFNKYTETACDSFNACRYAIAKVTAETDGNSRSKFMQDFLGEGEDLNQWKQLHEERQVLIGDVMEFVNNIMNKMKAVQSRMKQKTQYKTFQDCYDGFSSDESSIKAKVLQDKGLELRNKIITFFEKVQLDRGTTIEKEKFKQVVAGLLLVTGACCGMVVLGANPAAAASQSIVVRMGAAAIMDRAFDASTSQIEKSLAALPSIKKGGGGHRGEQFTKSEVERAIKFLENVESNRSIHETIQNPIKMVYNDTTTLSSSGKGQCNRHIEQIIKEGEKLIDACQYSIQKSPTNGNQDGDGKSETVKMSVGIMWTFAQYFKGGKSVKKTS
mmetsp:Transcript_5004/g.6469  ORF Transcript_5004/g.6469 Transcript_5004/m.6469 type:complete len:341 (+) Transcript_5004:219-1241(+)